MEVSNYKRQFIEIQNKLSRLWIVPIHMLINVINSIIDFMDTINTHFFCKNIVYKNIEPHILPTLKNILIAQNVSDLEMFLFCFEEAGKMKNLNFHKKLFLGFFWLNREDNFSNFIFDI